MKRLHLLILPLLLTSSFAAESFLVENGEPRAEIIIPEDASRTTRMAARELQVYLEKITGARLNIGAVPGEAPVKCYVGESDFTRRLGVTSEGLENGAFRIVSGKDWIVFIGDDTEFTPIEPWPKGYDDIRSGKMQEAWDRITGARWGYPHSQLHKHYSGPNALFGTPNERETDEEGNLHVWTYDERGSFNAVCGFLRRLGVRWYMPGEIGEVLPETDSITLPEIDETVNPDFPMRILNFRASVYGRDAMMWGFRLGVRQPYGRQAAHGLHTMTDNEATFRDHPDWFALYGGRRHNQPNIKNNQLCYSNEELLREAVRFARVQFDHFGMDVVSIMPPDGYTAICQCSQCAGKESPELGQRGMLSNYVWEFVNRVARELRESHPGKKISNCAYGIYTEPPNNIEKLEPNVQVIIVGGRRPTAEDREALRRLRSAWAEKTDQPIEIFENYPFTGRGFYLPAYIPRVLGESINETKGRSRGEDVWLTMDFGEDAIGFNHFLIYFTARMYWGGPDRDAPAMFGEYVERFYGPAAPEMRAFFSYCEENWRAMESDAEKAGRALELFRAAREKVDPESIHGRRIALIDNYLNGLRNKNRQLSQKRGPVPSLRLVSGVTQRGQIVIDGDLEDEPWRKIPVASTGTLRELQTGRLPVYGTSFKTEWIGNDLYFAIRCEDTPDQPLRVATEKDGDQAIWYGDAVEILLSTDSHNYYQIAVNPSGALVDLDRGAPRQNWFNWSSQAEVATRIGKDHWTVEIRIPVTPDQNDPLHQVVGRKPTSSLPWHINVCRQRIRDNGEEFSAFAPTGAAGFHHPMKFAHFHAGNSHRFPADPTVSDFLIESHAAAELIRGRKWNEALVAYTNLAEREKATDLQRSFALGEAVLSACQLQDYDRAMRLADGIPIPSAATTARMQILAAQRKWPAIVEQFGGEDIAGWPFRQVGEGAFVRGRSYFITGNGERAKRDLALALAHRPDPRTKTGIRTLLAQVHENLLDDPEGALRLYRANFSSRERIGGADEFRSVAGAASILAGEGRTAEALAAFDVVDFPNLKGFWRHEMLLARGGVLAAASRKTEALEDYRRVIEDPTASAAHRERAREKADSLR